MSSRLPSLPGGFYPHPCPPVPVLTRMCGSPGVGVTVGLWKWEISSRSRSRRCRNMAELNRNQNPDGEIKIRDRYSERIFLTKFSIPNPQLLSSSLYGNARGEGEGGW